ncbi:MAG: hypothetical protein H6668_19595 [Ardenticatenaceae bacterium]|nr:hypothetical protein [Ardenticatenaceae bacterium]
MARARSKPPWRLAVLAEGVVDGAEVKPEKGVVALRRFCLCFLAQIVSLAVPSMLFSMMAAAILPVPADKRCEAVVKVRQSRASAFP